MKQLIRLFIPCVMFLCVALPFCYAASSSSQPILMGLDVEGTMSITVTLYKNEPYASSPILSMDFGKLVELWPGSGTLRSSPNSTTGTGAVVAMVNVNSPSSAYTITLSGTEMRSGSALLPPGSCCVVPVYQAGDWGQSAMPSGAVLGTKGTWVGSNKLIYASEVFASIKVIRCYFSITDDRDRSGATDVVPLNQPGGTYQGQVTFSATAA